MSIRPVGHAALLVQYDSVSISPCGRERDDGGGEEEGDAQRSFPHRRFRGSDAGSRLARETPVLEDREVKEYARRDAHVVSIVITCDGFVEALAVSPLLIPGTPQ